MTKVFDLEMRTTKFSEEVIKLCRQIQVNTVNRPLLDQLVRCATSVGANYCEADDAESRRDFKHKIGICKKESRETKYFLRLLSVAMPNKSERIDALIAEAKELNLIFNSIFRNTEIS